MPWDRLNVLFTGAIRWCMWAWNKRKTRNECFVLEGTHADFLRLFAFSISRFLCHLLWPDAWRRSKMAKPWNHLRVLASKPTEVLDVIKRHSRFPSLFHLFFIVFHISFSSLSFHQCMFYHWATKKQQREVTK